MYYSFTFEYIRLTLCRVIDSMVEVTTSESFVTHALAVSRASNPRLPLYFKTIPKISEIAKKKYT